MNEKPQKTPQFKDIEALVSFLKEISEPGHEYQKIFHYALSQKKFTAQDYELLENDTVPQGLYKKMLRSRDEKIVHFFWDNMRKFATDLIISVYAKNAEKKERAFIKHLAVQEENIRVYLHFFTPGSALKSRPQNLNRTFSMKAESMGEFLSYIGNVLLPEIRDLASRETGLSPRLLDQKIREFKLSPAVHRAGIDRITMKKQGHDNIPL